VNTIKENQQLIRVLVDKKNRHLALYLVGLARQVFDESTFSTRVTKSGRAFFEFKQEEGASVYTPSSWLDIKFSTIPNNHDSATI
jgi:hypothetical protein